MKAVSNKEEKNQRRAYDPSGSHLVNKKEEEGRKKHR